MHRQFFQNRNCIQTFCIDRRNPFHFACRQLYIYMNSNKNNKICVSTHILVNISLVYIIKPLV